MKNYWSKEVLENNVYNNYKKAQIKRCIKKINKKRNPKYYEDVSFDFQDTYMQYQRC